MSDNTVSIDVDGHHIGAIATELHGSEQRRAFFYGPDWTIEPDIVDRAAGRQPPSSSRNCSRSSERGPTVADHHRNGCAFQLRQLAFVLDLDARLQRPTEA